MIRGQYDSMREREHDSESECYWKVKVHNSENEKEGKSDKCSSIGVRRS